MTRSRVSRTESRMFSRKGKYKYIMLAEGAVIGLITGALISMFRLLLTAADGLRERLAAIGTSGAGGALILALVLIAAAAVITALLVNEPDIAGSGIPQVEAELRGQKDMDWLRVIGSKMAGCAAAIGGGLALGREGPSIQIGAMVGKGFAKARHAPLTEERLLLTCGAGAGLSAAFGAPLAGAIFSLEELHRNFSAEVLITTMAAAAASDFVAANILGLRPVFDITVNKGLPLKYYWALILLGIVLGLFGAFYNKTIAFMQDASEKTGRAFAGLVCRIARKDVSVIKDGMHPTVFAARASVFGRLLAVFAAAYVLFFICPEALGSGSGLVAQISRGDFALKALAVLLLIKFVFSTASFGSGSPGGIFLPLLVLGALTGGLYSGLLGRAGLDQSYVTGYVVVAMAGYFAAIVRAPVTGVVLITEMTGDFTSLLPLVLTSLTAYVVAEALGAKPVYTQLLERSLGKPSAGRSSLLRDRKTVLDTDVHVGSHMDGRRVADFGLPLGTLIVSVTRDGVEIIPDGNTILRGGDELEILTRENDIADVESIVDETCHTVE